MTSQDIATLALLRWAELRKQSIPCKERLNDPELQRLERDLEIIRSCMERKS